MGMIDELPTKIDYEDNRTVPKGLHNVLDFQKLNVKLWNKANLANKEQRLFDKLYQWNNIYVAREHGFDWCLECQDCGYIDTWKGRFVHSCPTTGYANKKVLFLTKRGKAYEKMLANTPKKCIICGSDNCSLITGANYFYYVCDSPKCQDEINKQNDSAPAK